ncbi:MAG: hypothetical protein JRJ49_10090, partial [Deltaproteobacteria bacterium]|nr:hypothetical protein [Deltaproteobacteria bacterium]
YFPEYAWDGQEFEIIYTVNKYTIFIFGKKDKEGGTSIELDYPEELALAYKQTKAKYKKFVEEQYIITKFDQFAAEAKVFNKDCENLVKPPVFIPAGRSFFAALQKNIFSFLTLKDFNIDPFILEFGAKYERSKEDYKKIFEPKDDDSDKEFKVKIKSIAESILSGKYK